MAADAGELHAKFMRDFVAGRDVVQHEGGQGVAILFELHRNAAGRRVAVVGNRDAHPHFDAGRPDPEMGSSDLIARFGRASRTHSNEMDLRNLFLFFQVGKQLADLGGTRELAGAKVAYEVDDQCLARSRRAGAGEWL